MNNIANLLTEHIDIWTAAESEKKSGRGRASGNAGNVYGVKKLRELILELAVRGKLVPQDPNNEPASELLKRIQAEKTKLIAEGKLKKDRQLSPISEDEKPFELPQGWEYSKLGHIAQKLTDGSHNPPRDSGSGIPMLSSQNVNYGFIDFDNPSRYVTKDEFLAENSRTKIEVGDVLLTIVGSLGRAAVVEQDSPKFVLQRSVAAIKTGLLPEYLCLQFGAPFCINYFEENGKGTAQKGIYLGQLADMLITVPPLPEQQRIVAKVDELMALCDKLEQQHSNAQEAHEALVSQLLATLTQSQNSAEFNANWQRIYAHFDVLFTTEASIDALKQTLLQLAVMGKLVPKDPFDEPASELLKRIKAEKAKLIAEGKLKKEKPLAPISEDEKPFELPIGWSWIYFGDYSVIERGGSPRPIQDYITNEESGLNWIKISDTSVNSKYITSTQEKIRKEGLVKTRMVYPGDFLLTNSMSFGRPYITKIQGCIHDGWLRIHPSEVMDKDFLYQLLMSPYVYGAFTQSAAGAVVKNLNADKVRELKIPIPPLAEQHRIVAKVEALMALCDQLKTCIQQANQQQQLIADALVTQAVA